MKYLGAAYLIYLGIRSFLSREDGADRSRDARDPKRLTTIFRESIVVNVLNPKTALFFFAFLPQFVDPAGGAPVASQIIVLGLIFIAVGLLSDGLYAVFAGVLGDRLRRSGRHWGRYITGRVYRLGVMTALGSEIGTNAVITLDQFRLFARYNQDMNRKVYGAAGRLTRAEIEADRGAFFGSILGTLNHVLVGDLIWLHRFAPAPQQALRAQFRPVTRSRPIGWTRSCTRILPICVNTGTSSTTTSSRGVLSSRSRTWTMRWST